MYPVRHGDLRVTACSCFKAPTLRHEQIALDERLLGDTGPVERLREWFGTPFAAGKTLIWLCWASLVASVLFGLLLGLLYLLAWGVEAVVT